LSASSCENYYSHTGVKLKDHLAGVGGLCKKYAAPVRPDEPRIGEAAEIIGKCHDVAKYTTFFQKRLLGERVRGDLSTHSRLSAIFTSWLMNKRLRDPLLAAVGFLCVDSHHGNLKSFDLLGRAEPDWLGDPVIMEQAKSIRNNIGVISSELEEVGLHEISDFIQNFERYLPEVSRMLRSATHLLRFRLSERERWFNYYNALLLFSSLIDADKKDAGKVKTEFLHEKLDADLVLKYYQKKFGSANSSEINEIRKSLFSEVDNRLREVMKNMPKIITITAPTGTGKTLMGLHVALKLKEKIGCTRVVYCLPYINIIEQTHKVAEDVLSAYYGEAPDISVLLKHHHLFFPSRESISEDIPLDKLLLLTDSWESELVVTTFEQLLRSIIGCKNSLLKKFHNLVGSILILDEVQAIPLEYWRLVRDALLFLAENFDMRIILMTATMPAIFKDKGVELVPQPENYFKRMGRTKLIPQIGETVNAEQFADFFISKWKKGKSALLVLNTVGSSKKVYRRIAERLGDEAVMVGKASDDEIADQSKVVLAYLSTSVIPKERKRRIELLKNLLKGQRSAILVSTQVVEAGVDLDFDIAFRDLAPLDSIVQVAGRCNRNWRSQASPVYVLKVVDENGREDSMKIYGRILPERTIQFFDNKRTVGEQELAELMKSYYEDVSYRMNAEKDPHSVELLQKIKALDFQGLAGFSLIKEEPKVPVYIEYDDEAKRLLREFEAIVKDLEKIEALEKVFEFKAILRKLRAEMENYVVEVYENETCLRSLKPIMTQVNMRFVSSEEVPAYYDPETGFKTAKDEKENFLIF
jgi:CRISPR-associated endonuclease/helicase Cas3